MSRPVPSASPLAFFALGRPASPDEYLHVAGRTARAGRAGVAVTLAPTRDADVVLSWAAQLDVAFEARDPADVGPAV